MRNLPYSSLFLSVWYSFLFFLTTTKIFILPWILFAWLYYIFVWFGWTFILFGVSELLELYFEDFHCFWKIKIVTSYCLFNFLLIFIFAVFLALCLFVCFLVCSFLFWEDPLEKGKATYSSILAWRIPWTI